MDAVFKAEKRNFTSDLMIPSKLLQNFSEVIRKDNEIFCSKPLEAVRFEDAARIDIRHLAEHFDIEDDLVTGCLRQTKPGVLGIGEAPSEIVTIDEHISDGHISELLFNRTHQQNPYAKQIEKIDPNFLKFRPKALIICETTEETDLCKRLESVGRRADDEVLPDQNGEASDGLADIVFTVRVFSPVQSSSKLKNGGEFVEFQFLGHQKLTELRDAVPCINNKVLRTELSEQLDDIELHREDGLTTDIYNSGTIYIGKTLYSDVRKAGRCHYAETLANWGLQKGRNIKFETAIMDETRFDQLELRLGFPYVYNHLGNCEHLILFVDVRLLHPSDIGNPSLYPILTRTFGSPEERCYACDTPKSRWLVVGSEKLPVPSAFFCDKCMKLLFYKKGEKRGDFKLYLVEPDLRYSELKDVGTQMEVRPV